MKENKIEIVVNYEKCSPCSELACVDTCPQGVLQIDQNKKLQVLDITSCTACGICENLCPSKAIKVKRGCRLF